MAVPVITNQQLNDYAISKTETTIASCNVTNMTANNDVVVVVNNKAFVMDTTDNAAYTKTISGFDIGICSTQTITFMATNDDGGDDEEAGSTITVTESGSFLKDNIVSFLRTRLTDYNIVRNNTATMVYPDTPRIDLSAVSYPRVSVGQQISHTAEPLGLTSTSDHDKVRLQIDVWTKKDVVHSSMEGEGLVMQVMKDIKTAFRTYWRTDLTSILVYRMEGFRTLPMETDTNIFHGVITVYLESVNSGEW